VATAAPGAVAVWVWSLVLSTSLIAIIGFARGGSTLFWKSTAFEGAFESAAQPVALPMIAVGLLLAGLVLLTAFAGPVTAYMDLTAGQLFAPMHYIDAVLGEGRGS
jgi:multicomponent K+:H+ antiporter subunit D